MIQIDQSPLMEICDPFDAHMIVAGPPALFTMDARDRLRMDSNRTRICWEGLCAPPDRQLCHALIRDPATGWVQYALATSPALLESLQAHIFPDQKAALDALSTLGQPPIGPLPAV